ncbi:MAG: PKD domain-containing protein [Bacteroidales bacterium]|nr:PKD domain-containing protein [Bacteroidales bacterium]
MIFTNNKILVLLGSLLLLTNLSFSQVNVNISANKLEGCAPFEVLFSANVNNCTGSVSYSWDFDYLGGNSSQANPGTVFQNAGTYNVSLSITCAEGSATDNVTITVYDPPIADIGNSVIKGCKPLSVNFQDASTPGGGAINTWEWYFNDGTPMSNEQNPNHIYNFPGSFNLMLIVKDENGCSSQITSPALVVVSDTPQVAFSAFPLSYCNPPLTVDFQANVVTNFNLSYDAIWNFGDGSANVTGNAVQHTYTNANIYDVSLTVIDEYGCSNSVTYNDYINITELVPEFSMFFGSTQIEPGQVICPNTTIHFTNLTAYNCKWDFGNGQTSELNIVNYSFTEPGTYNLKFTVQPDGDCENSIEFILYVEDYNVGFTTNPENLFECNIPFVVEFTNTSSPNITNFEYTFGDGESSNSPSPTHTYTNSGSFPVVLTASTDNGCSATATTQVIIHSPDASFSYLEGEGCAPLEEYFEYTGSDGATIESYTWDFGDGSQSVTQNPPISYVFQNAGEYEVSLSVFDGECTATSTQTIYVGEPIQGDLTFQLFDDVINDWYDVTELIHCAQDTFRIINPLFDHPDIDDFEWQLDSIYDNSDEEFTMWAFDQDTGYVNVMFVTNFNGCRDTLHLDSIFYINGPIISSIQRSFECENPFEYSFKLNLLHPDDDLSLNWDWFINQGDNAEINLYQELGSTNDELVYTFPGLGEYWVKVLAKSTETGCEFRDSIKVEVIESTASFIVSNANVCTGSSVHFDASASTSAITYIWDFGDGSPIEETDNPIIEHVFEGYGDFTITLSIRDNNGCEVSTQRIIHSSGPAIEIITNPSPAHGCNSLDVEFSFNYQSDYPLSHNIWQISGSSQSIYTSSFERTFGPGTYDVSLQVSNTNNCSATVTEPALVVVSSIEAHINTLNPVECVGIPVQFNSVLEDNTLNYTWDFGDGGNSNQINPEYTYTNSGIYDVSLQIDDGFGCVSTDQIQIEVQGLDIDFTIAKTNFDCYPAFLDITNNTDEFMFNPSWEWTFGNGDTLPVYEPLDYFIDGPGVYWAKLTGTTAHGCVNSDSVKIEINGPVFNYFYHPSTICLHDTVHFKITDMQNDYDIRWYIRGMQFTTPTVDFVFDEMPSNGVSEVQLIVEHGGCEVLRTMQVYVQQVITDFDIIDSIGNIVSAACSPIEFKLINNSQNADTITWTLGNQTYPGTDSLAFSIENNTIFDSVFNITCFGTNQLGCTDSITKTYTVFGKPHLKISNDTLICLGDELKLYAEGGTQIIWHPNEFIDDINSLQPIISPETDITYHALITDINNCTASDSVQIRIQDIPEFELFPVSDSIIIGDTVYVSSSTNQVGLTYFWAPNTEISCIDCPYPILSPKEDQRYTVTVQDSLGCYSHNYFIDIFVSSQYSLDVPSAFTPLGHESNRVVYAKGYGIKRFIEFRIFNRWGEEVFFTDDINIGWDGYYKGQLQNIDTYKYFVKAEMWNDEVYVKKGDILLMR